MAKPSRRARLDEIRTAGRRMFAIIVFVLALTLTSPPASAPTDREPPFIPPAGALDTDPLLGPWVVEQFLTPYLVAQDPPSPPQDRPAAAATGPSLGVRAVLLARRTRLAALTFWEFVRHGSTAIRLGVLWVQQMTWHSWPDEMIIQAPLPSPIPVLDALPTLTPNGFQDILDCGGLGPMRGGRHMPVASLDTWDQGFCDSCF
jgi:hypothetical protein